MNWKNKSGWRIYFAVILVVLAIAVSFGQNTTQITGSIKFGSITANIISSVEHEVWVIDPNNYSDFIGNCSSCRIEYKPKVFVKGTYKIVLKRNNSILTKYLIENLSSVNGTYNTTNNNLQGNNINNTKYLSISSKRLNMNYREELTVVITYNNRTYIIKKSRDKNFIEIPKAINLSKAIVEVYSNNHLREDIVNKIMEQYKAAKNIKNNKTYYINLSAIKVIDSKNHTQRFKIELINKLSVSSITSKHRYSIRLIPENMSVKEIIFRDLLITPNLTVKFEQLDPQKFSPLGIKGFAIDPTNLNFSYGEIKAIAKGNALYKCKNYSYEQQKCLGSFVKIKILNPGEEYTINITKEDPAYLEIMESVAQAYTTNAQNGQNTIAIGLEKETYIDSNFGHPTISRISVNEDGIYKVSYGCGWIEPSSLNRQLLENWIKVNGNIDLIPSHSFCYIRRNNTDGNRCSNSGVVLVNLSKSDYVELMGRVAQAESSGEIDTYADCWLYIEKETHKVAEVYMNNSDLKITSTPATVPLDTVYYSDSIYNLSNNKLSIGYTGWYKLYYTVCSEDQSVNARQTYHSWLRVNGVNITASNSYTYTRNNAVANRNCNHGYLIKHLNSGDSIEIQHNLKATESSGTSVVLQQSTWLVVEKLKYAKGFLYEANGGQSFSDGTEQKVSFDTNEVMDYPFIYNNNNEIEVNESGMYEITYNLGWQDDGGYDRIIVCAYIKRNGNKITPSQQCDYSRGDPQALWNNVGGQMIVNLTKGDNISLYAIGSGSGFKVMEGTTWLSIYKLGWTNRDIPTVHLLSPANNTLVYTDEIELNYSVDDLTTYLNCSLWINKTGSWQSYQTQYNVVKALTHSFHINLNNGKYVWNVQCNNSKGLSDFGDYNYTIIVQKPNASINKKDYLVAENIQITGKDWDPNSNITIEIRNSSNSLVDSYTLMSNGYGEFSSSWHIPASLSRGSYELIAYKTTETYKRDSKEFFVEGLIIEINKDRLVRGETLLINSKVFRNNTNVTITIYDPTSDPVVGYPRKLLSNSTGAVNDSWQIPSNAALGTYTINLTEDYNTERTIVKTFEVVNAIIETKETSYEQGSNATLIGSYWDQNTQVYVNITNSNGELIYNKTLTANSSGELSDTFFIEYNETFGVATINAIEPSNTNKRDTNSFNIVERNLILKTDYPWYRHNEVVNINGDRFSNNNVSLDITDSSGVSVNNYPKNLTTNSSGGFTDSWTITNENYGTYTINATDLKYSNLNKQINILIVHSNITTDKNAYKTGELVIISGEYWDRNSSATLDIVNESGSSIDGYPKTITTDSDGSFIEYWTADSNSLGVVYYNINVNDTKENSTITIAVTRSATLNTDKDKYFNYENVSINGSYYTSNGDVKLIIRSLDTNGIALGYPKVVQADSNGYFEDSWNTSNYCAGQYQVESTDLTYPNLLNAVKKFNITYTDYSTLTCNDYWNGDCGEGPPEGFDNTLDNCANGAGNDESIEDISVNATVVTPGETINITCTIDPYTSNDYYHIFYNNGSGWVEIYNEGPTGSSSIVTISTTYTIHNVIGEHWIRCSIDYSQNDQDGCADSGSWYDNDDIAIRVIKKVDNCVSFDGTPPNVTIIEPAEGTNITIGSSIIIKANITDDRNMSKARVIIYYPNGSILSETMTNISSIYSYTFNDTLIRGRYNVSIIANDSWNNINDSERTYFNVIYDQLTLTTDKQNYVIGETVNIKGTGFNAFSNINIDLYNSSKVSVSGYPKTLTSNRTGGINDLWTIPSTQALGTYYINTYDQDDNSRNITTTFNIVTAIIEANGSVFEQGSNITIKGSYWDPNTEVYINITNEVGELVYNKTLTANSSGELKDYYFINYNETISNYTISAIEPSNTYKHSSYKYEVVKRLTNITTDYSWYKVGEEVNITGTKFSRDGTITIDIVNSSNISVSGYPKNISADNNGNINDLWSIPSTQALGNYTIKAYDYSYRNLNATTKFEIVKQIIITSKQLYRTGETVEIYGYYWNRSTQLTLTLYNSTGGIVSGYPKTTIANSNGQFNDLWIAHTQLNLEQFNISGEQGSLKAYSLFNVSKTTTVFTDKNIYYSYETVNITGSAYTENGDVKLWIKDSNNATAYYYPKTITANNVGDIEHIWNTSIYCPGTYYVYTKDVQHPTTKYANTSFEIRYTDYSTLTCNDYWNRDCGEGPPEGFDNTLDNCANGAGNDESIEDISVNATVVTPGETINITCTIDPYTSNDYYHIFYNNGSGWVEIYNEGPTGSSSIVTISTTYTIHNVIGEHWIRCSIDYSQNDQDGCADSGSWYDNDDVAIRVIKKVDNCVSFDGTPPTITNVIPQGDEYVLLGNVSINATITDNDELDYAKVNISYPNGTIKLFNMSNISSSYYFNFNDTKVIGRYNFTIIARDISDNFAYATGYFIIKDITPPAYDNISINPQSPQNYSQDLIISFNITWTDNYEFDTAIIEHNFTGTLQNYTMNYLGNNVWSYSYSKPAAGSYWIKFYGKDSSNNINSTEVFNYTINRSTPLLNLTLNGYDSDITVEYNSSATLNGTSVKPTGAYLKIYKNNTLIAQGNSVLSINYRFDELGSFNISLVFEGDQNYTNGSTSHIVNVIDSAYPSIVKITPEDNITLNLSNVIEFKVNATDNYAIDKVWIKYYTYEGDVYRDNLIVIGNDMYYTNLTTNSSFIGLTNYTIFANDTSGNTVNISSRFITLDNLSIDTDKQSYVRGEVVNIAGKGFNINTNVTINIINSSGSSVSGYPKNVSSNATGGIKESWTIPLTQALGTYYVIATDTKDNHREVNTTFDIVTAIIESDYESYEQGSNMTILGSHWDPNAEVYVNITNSNGELIYNKTLTANSSGELKDYYFIDYNASIGSYLMSAIEPSNSNKYDSYTFNVVKRIATLTTDYEWYKVNEVVNINGTKFSRDGTITIDIVDSNNISVSGYPKNITADNNGNINDLWSIPSTLALGNYTVKAYDYTYRNLNASKEISIVKAHIETDSNSYQNGDLVEIRGYYWDRNENITLNIYNLSGVSVDSYPINLTTNDNGEFTAQWTAKAQEITATIYNITADALYSSETDTINITVLVRAILSVDHDYYDQYENVSILGSYYTANSNVKLIIYNTETGAYVPEMPELITANSSGDISKIWNTKDYCEAKYGVKAIDMTYPNTLYAETFFDIYYYYANSTLGNVIDYSVSGNFNNNNSGVSRIQTSDNDWLWFGAKDLNSRLNAWINLSINLSKYGELNKSFDKIINITYTIEYCHSGLQQNPSCGQGYPHEGLTNGPQLIQIWNFNNSKWENLSELPVDDSSDNEYSYSFSAGYPLMIYIRDNITYIRIEMDFNESGYDDDLLMIDYIKVNITYREHTNRSCTLVDDIIGEAKDINQSNNINISITINNTIVNYTKDYDGVMNISFYNGYQLLISFLHNFTYGPLNLTEMTVLLNNNSIAAEIPNHNITMYVPIVDNICNVLVCPGAMNKSECNINYTVYVQREGNYCPVEVSGTYAEDQPDNVDLMVNASSIKFSAQEFIENKNITVYGEVFNIGMTNESNVSVELWLNNKTLLYNNTFNITANSSITFNLTWIVKVGTNIFEIRVDPPISTGGKIAESNETNNNYSITKITSIWQIYYGHINATTVFGNKSNIAYKWVLTNFTGNVYVTDSDSVIDWDKLQAIGKDINNNTANNDFNDIDEVLNTSQYEDNITTTFTYGGTPRAYHNFTVNNKLIADVPVINSTNSSNFLTGILWDYSTDTNNEFDTTDKENLVFIGNINVNKNGKFGRYDYEIKVPVQMQEYKGSNKAMYVYVEIR